MADCILTGTFASIPAASNAGQLYLPSDGFCVYRDSGSAWVPWGPLFPNVAPDDGDFSWVNQGGASVDTTYGGIHLIAPAGAGINLRVRVKSIPSVPYVVTALVLVASHNNFWGRLGLVFRQSSDGKIQTLNVGTNAIEVLKYTDATTYSANYAARTIVPNKAPQLLWLRLEDDNTDRKCYWSTNGQNWHTVHSVGRTDFLTADQVGFYANAENATYPAHITLLSWEET